MWLVARGLKQLFPSFSLSISVVKQIVVLVWQDSFRS